MSFAPPKPVTREMWPTRDMPEERRALGLHRSFSTEEFHKLRQGVKPEGLADKWFAFYEEGWLNLHRSDSGVCVYRIRLVERDGQWDVARCEVNDHRRQRRTLGDAYDVAFCEWVLDNVLLGRVTSRPRPPLKG